MGQESETLAEIRNLKIAEPRKIKPAPSSKLGNGDASQRALALFPSNVETRQPYPLTSYAFLAVAFVLNATMWVIFGSLFNAVAVGAVVGAAIFFYFTRPREPVRKPDQRRIRELVEWNSTWTEIFHATGDDHAAEIAADERVLQTRGQTTATRKMTAVLPAASRSGRCSICSGAAYYTRGGDRFCVSCRNDVLNDERRVARASREVAKVRPVSRYRQMYRR